MPSSSSILPEDAVDTDRLFLIVVGASVEAEVWHRPLAYRLQELIDRWQEQYCDVDIVDPLVMTDAWYMANSQLHHRPCVAIGAPNHNALTAYLSDRIPAVFGVEQRLVIQADPTFTHQQICLWGAGAAATAEALDAFADRYLEDLLKHIVAEEDEQSDLAENNFDSGEPDDEDSATEPDPDAGGPN